MDLEKGLKEYSVVLTNVPGRTSEIHQIPYQIPMAMANAEIVELWQFTVVIISKNDKNKILPRLPQIESGNTT